MTVWPNSHYQSLWLGAVVMVVLALPLAALQGSANDWLRLGVYAVATAAYVPDLTVATVNTANMTTDCSSRRDMKSISKGAVS